MADGTDTDTGLLDDAYGDGDIRAGTQQATNLSSSLHRKSCLSPAPKRIKYVHCKHCFRDVSEKTCRNHWNLHFACRERDDRGEYDDRIIMQGNADPGMLS